MLYYQPKGTDLLIRVRCFDGHRSPPTAGSSPTSPTSKRPPACFAYLCARTRPGRRQAARVEYLTERSPELDHTSLRSVARSLCRLFWRDLEIHHPGIDSLRLAPEVAQAWKERLAHIRDADGQPVRPRVNYRSELVFVRAFYEDIARWAADDPARWSPWVAPCPIRASEVTRKKAQARVKARMDQRTRTQLPLLPALLRAVEQHRKDAEERIATATATPAGGRFTAGGE